MAKSGVSVQRADDNLSITDAVKQARESLKAGVVPAVDKGAGSTIDMDDDIVSSGTEWVQAPPTISGIDNRQDPGNEPESEEMVAVYDRERDTLKQVPASSVVGSRSMVDREWELRDLSALDTSMYAGNVVYHWVNIGKDGAHSQFSARSLGYVPIRDQPKTPHHVMRKVEGIGEIPTVGDLGLFGCPIEEVERREDKKHRDAESNTGSRARGARFVEEMGEQFGADNIFLTEEKWKTQLINVMTNEDTDRSEAMARSLERAQEQSGIASERERREYRGSKSFSGFDGPANRGAVPPSPYMRNRR